MPSPQPGRAFEVSGSDMLPTLSAGSVVLATTIGKAPEQLRPGQVYVLVTANEVLIRRLHAARPKSLLLDTD